MYWAIVFCRRVMYSSTGPSPAASIASPMDGYTNLLSGCRWGCLPVIWQATRLRKPPSDRQRRGVTTHVYNTKRRTAWMTTLKNVPDVLVSAPYHPRTCGIRAHFFLAFLRLAIAAGKLLSVVERRRKRYLNDPALARGWP